ncbi:hypothetical protein AB0M44_43875 [Streptosporangium subroseum]
MWGASAWPPGKVNPAPDVMAMPVSRGAVRHRAGIRPATSCVAVRA